MVQPQGPSVLPVSLFFLFFMSEGPTEPRPRPGGDEVVPEAKNQPMFFSDSTQDTTPILCRVSRRPGIAGPGWEERVRAVGRGLWTTNTWMLFEVWELRGKFIFIQVRDR